MLLLVTDPEGVGHRAGPHHPECPERLGAVMKAARDPLVVEAIETVRPEPSTRAELARVHSTSMLDRLETVRGLHASIDADTAVSPHSVEIAYRAAGAGITAVAALDAGSATAAFCAVRPPGHHATASTSMGFCLLNNIAVTAAALVARGERVVIADFDAHHGNGTQDIFYDDPSVMFVSWHQSPLYPGTGAVSEIGGANARGGTLNIPLVPGSTGDCYLRTLDDVVGATLQAFSPTWLLISAGFDAHRDDPLTDLGLTAGDFNRLTIELSQLVPSGRTIAFLEGGYDLAALEASALATYAGLLGLELQREPLSVGGGSLSIVDRVRDARSDLGE